MTRSTSAANPSLPLDRVLLGAAIALFTLAVVLTAWLCDDAYITFRSVENFVRGDGLRWNVAERVQSFTHPLWMLAMSLLYFATGEVYYSSLALSVACSVCALLILAYRVASSTRLALLAVTPLLLSRAFVDYSTSGLENPLSHLLLALFFWFAGSAPREGESDARHALKIAWIAALIGLNRLDALLLVGPALLAFVAMEDRWRSRAVVRALALGLLPLVLWEIFSLVYYGFPFPNTAYAKLSTGIPRSALALQGLHYFADSLARDPLTLVSIAGGIAIACFSPEPARRRLLPIAAGIGLYLLYIVWIGGDFMSGRLFTAPLFCAAVLLARGELLSQRASRIALATALALAIIVGLPTLTSGPGFGDPPGAAPDRPHGISDERAFYYPHTGLLRRWLGLARVEDHIWAVRGRAAREAGITWAQGQAMGLYGFYAGPRVHVLDMVGLSDPLLARIDARKPWRIGHFERKIPRGYVDTLRSGSNRLADPELAAFYDALARLTRDPVFDFDRFQLILRLNTGAYDSNLAAYRARTADGSP